MYYFLVLEKVHKDRICPFTICHSALFKKLLKYFYIVIQPINQLRNFRTY